MKSIMKFLSGIKKEMERVRWPSLKDMTKYSVAVISILLFFSLFFFVTDLVIVWLKAR